MIEPFVSIIVPVYKVPEQYLRKCIESTMTQTLKNIEILLVDDGSPDQCGKICDEYAEKDKRIRVLHKKNGGLSSARNFGCKAAQGKWVMFVDGDDWIEPDMCQTMYSAGEEKRVRLLKIDSFSALLICILFLSEALYSLLGQIVRGLGYNARYSVSVVVYSTVNLVATAVLLMGFHLGLQGVIISLTIGYLGADTYMVIASGMIGYFKLDKFSSVSLKELLHFSMPIVPSSIALWVVNLSDRLIIIHFMGAAANGIYAVANKIPSLYSTAYGIFNLAWTETASKVSDDGDPAEYYTKLFSGLFKFLIGVMLALIAVTPIIFSVLVKGDYGAAFFQVPILYFGIFFNSLVNFYSGIYIALKRTKQVGYSSVAGAIINAAINVLLIGEIGLYAASISTAVSFLVIAIYRAIDLNKVIEIKYNMKEIAVGMGLFFMATVCLNCNQVWAIILCWCIAGIYNITQNMQIAKKMIRKFLKK